MPSPRATADEGYLLRRNPYRDRSWLTVWLTREHGLVSAVARASARRLAQGGGPEAFRRTRLCWSGRGDLKSLVGCDPEHMAGGAFHGEALFAGLYCNDLFGWVLRRGEADSVAFALYETAVARIGGGDLANAIRSAERGLLDHAGFGLVLERDARGEPLVPEAWYAYRFETGLVPDPEGRARPRLRGRTALALAAGRLEAGEERDARELLQAALRYFLEYEGYHRFASCLRFARSG